MNLYENITNARQQITNSPSDTFVLTSIGYNIGCIAHMLKGVCNNTASALQSLNEEMRNEMISLLRLYIEVYPLSVSTFASYLAHQMEAFIHRLVIVLKEDMFLPCLYVM